MRFHLRDLNPTVVEAWSKEFAHAKDVEISAGRIFDVVADAIVSPANSFGFMDGGIDLVYSRRFGWGLQERLQKIIREEHDGDLPIGAAVVVPTDDEEIPHLISAPTMRIPMDVSETLNAYLAFRAVIRIAREFNRTASTPITSILCPGLCTATGRMSADACARQMHWAYVASHLGQVWSPPTLGAAVAAHRKMTGGW